MVGIIIGSLLMSILQSILLFVSFINSEIIIITEVNKKEKDEKRIRYQKAMNILLIILLICCIESLIYGIFYISISWKKLIEMNL